MNIIKKIERFVTNGVTRECLVDILDEIQRRKYTSIIFLMSDKDFSNIYNWGREEFDPETLKEVRETGRMGSIFGVEVIINKNCPVGNIYGIAYIFPSYKDSIASLGFTE